MNLHPKNQVLELLVNTGVSIEPYYDTIIEGNLIRFRCCCEFQYLGIKYKESSDLYPNKKDASRDLFDRILIRLKNRGKAVVEQKIEKKIEQKVETPIRQIETPIRQIETPIRQIETPIRQIETPIRQIETPIRQIETPIRQIETPIRQIKNTFLIIDHENISKKEVIEKIDEFKGKNPEINVLKVAGFLSTVTKTSDIKVKCGGDNAADFYICVLVGSLLENARNGNIDISIYVMTRDRFGTYFEKFDICRNKVIHVVDFDDFIETYNRNK